LTGDSIFLVNDTELVRMTAAEFELEDIPQDLIARYPELLGGGQITPDDPRRWVLVRREAGVPREEGGGSQWHLDHLFLDQDGIPTLVEVKRSSNREIRRMIVGQMLDYAANAVRYWPIAELIERFETTCTERGAEPADVLIELIGEDGDPEDFWSEVEENLRSGRIRLLFVADRIPTELQAIIEFLNEQMERTEVLGVEIRQYVGEDLRTLVPRVIGQTAVARSVKSTGDSRNYEERLQAGTKAVQEFDTLIQDLGVSIGLRTTTSKAARQIKAPWGTALSVYASWGTVEFPLGPLRKRGFDEDADRFLTQLREMTDDSLTDLYPAISAAALIEHWDRFTSDFLPDYLEVNSRAWS